MQYLNVKKIGSADVYIDIIPKANKTSRPGKKLRALRGITVHTTGNKRKGADARMHTEYVDNTSEYISWHLTVDDKSIYQELPFDEVAWHAGDGGNGEGNNTQIAIEICEHEDIDWEKARANAIALIVHLLIKFKMTPGDLSPHKRWNGKWCPAGILNDIKRGGWNGFIQDVHVPWSTKLYYTKDQELDAATKDDIIRLEKKLDKLLDQINFLLRYRKSRR